MDRNASRRPPGAATISAPPPAARSSRSCRTGSIAPSPNRTRRMRPRSGTPTSVGAATTTEQLLDDRVPREARKRRQSQDPPGDKYHGPGASARRCILRTADLRNVGSGKCKVIWDGLEGKGQVQRVKPSRVG